MKRIVSLLLIIVLVFSMTACAKSDPAASVSGFLDGLKDGNIEKMSKYVKSGYEEQVEEVLDSTDETSFEAFKTAFGKLEYTILQTEVDDNTATVETEINAANLGMVMAELITEALPLAFASAFSEDASEDDMEELMSNMLLDKVTSDDIPMIEKTVQINLVKENENWVINTEDEANEDFLNAITGNLNMIGELFE